MENQCYITYMCLAYPDNWKCKNFVEHAGFVSCKYAEIVSDVYAMCGCKSAQEEIEETQNTSHNKQNTSCNVCGAKVLLDKICCRECLEMDENI